MSEEQEKIYIDDIAGRLAELTGEEAETAKEFIHTLFETIGEELMAGDRVPVYQFGVFKKSFIEERQGRNPNTGEEITIPAHYRVGFSPSENLAEAVNEKYRHLEAYDIPDVPASDKDDDVDAIPVLSGKKERVLLPDGEETVEEHPGPVENDEMAALIGPEKEEQKPERRRALLAVLSAALVALLLGAFLLGRYSAVNRTEEIIIVDAEEKPGPAAEPEQESEEKAAAGPVLQRSLVREHTVVPGNTFVSLAETYWGDKHLWPVLYLDNKEAFPNPNYLQPGQTVDILTSPAGEDGLSEAEEEYVLAAYVEMYHVYRDLGEDLIASGKRSNSSYLQSLGFRRLMEARTVIFTATRYNPDFHTDARSVLRGDDYAILERYIDFHGPFEEF